MSTLRHKNPISTNSTSRFLADAASAINQIDKGEDKPVTDIPTSTLYHKCHIIQLN